MGSEVREKIYNYFKDNPILFQRMFNKEFSKSTIGEMSDLLLSRILAGIESYNMSDKIHSSLNERVEMYRERAKNRWAKAVNFFNESEKLRKLLSKKDKLDKDYKTMEFAMNDTFNSYITNMELGNRNNKIANDTEITMNLKG